MAKSRESKMRKQAERFARFQEMARRPVTKRKTRRRTRRGVGIAARAPHHNPPLLTDILEYAIPGFGGFAATKFITNAAAAQIAKRWPQYAKHAAGLSSVGSFLGAWYFGHRVKFLSRWHTPIVVGSALAAAQNIIQIYFPDKLSWILGSPKQAAQGAIAQQVAVQQQQQQQQAQLRSSTPALPDHLEEIQDDPSWYTFNDAYDAGRYKANPPVAAPAAGTEPVVPLDDEDLATGLFANNGMTANLEN